MNMPPLLPEGKPKKHLGNGFVHSVFDLSHFRISAFSLMPRPQP
jgi:hypothetical protein